MVVVVKCWQHLGLLLQNKGVIRHSQGICSLGDGGTLWCVCARGGRDERGLLGCVGKSEIGGDSVNMCV